MNIPGLDGLRKDMDDNMNAFIQRLDKVIVLLAQNNALLHNVIENTSTRTTTHCHCHTGGGGGWRR